MGVGGANLAHLVGRGPARDATAAACSKQLGFTAGFVGLRQNGAAPWRPQRTAPYHEQVFVDHGGIVQTMLASQKTI